MSQSKTTRAFPLVSISSEVNFKPFDSKNFAISLNNLLRSLTGFTNSLKLLAVFDDELILAAASIKISNAFKVR